MAQTLITHPRSKHWQLAPSDLDGASQGTGQSIDIVQGYDDIEQCIFNILSTRKGTDATRPEFGSNHFDYIDTPEDIFVPNAVREVVLAITTWEKRAVIDKVEFSGNAPEITMSVYWHAADDVAAEIRRTDMPMGASWM